MTIEAQIKLRICLGALLAAVVAVIGFLLFDSLLFAALNQEKLSEAGHKCIGCHVATYNQGIESRTIHQPFREENCVICHLAEGADWTPDSSSPKTGISGKPASQQVLWRKTQSFATTETPLLEQRILLPALELETDYRFRIIVGQPQPSAQGLTFSSSWLGLRPQELTDDSQAVRLEVPSGLTVPAPEVVSLSRSGSDVIIAWQTRQPFYGRVALQRLQGPGFEDPESISPKVRSEGTREHPALRTGEDLAINACYQCHPQSTLGTSHPVRLYGSAEVKIPVHLPTVDGMLSCVTCHNPHGAIGLKLVRETITTKLCISCHYSFQNSSTSTIFD